jgi:hypothetical protein
MANEEKMTITGGYSNEELQRNLQVYINRFVICPKCGIPETIPQLIKENKKTSTIELKCSSCCTQSKIVYNNKIETKTSEQIIKFLEKNEWSVVNKGIMVKSQISNEQNINEEFNPFS